MAYFPMFVELEGRPCLIVGGGAVALRKARRLLPYGPCLTVVAQSFVPELEALEGAALCRRAFRPRDVEGQALVVAATGDGALNREIAALCRARRTLLSVLVCIAAGLDSAFNNKFCSFTAKSLKKFCYLSKSYAVDEIDRKSTRLNSSH